MKHFRFTLEAVSIVRQRQEQKAVELYAHTLANQQKAREALEKAEREMERAQAELRGQLTRGCQAQQAAQAAAYQQSLSQHGHDCAAAFETAERRVNAAFKAFLHARRQREMVDKCFDKQLARHRRDLARGEQRFLDDLAGRRASSIFAWKPAESSP